MAKMTILIKTVAIGRMISYGPALPVTLNWSIEDDITAYYTKSIFNLAIEDIEI